MNNFCRNFTETFWIWRAEWELRSQHVSVIGWKLEVCRMMGFLCNNTNCLGYCFVECIRSMVDLSMLSWLSYFSFILSSFNPSQFPVFFILFCFVYFFIFIFFICGVCVSVCFTNFPIFTFFPRIWSPFSFDVAATIG